MYERTSETRGESLEPNPFGQGEFIEHKHAPITCYNEIHPFPMLRVGFWPSTLPHGSVMLILVHNDTVTLCLQKAKGRPRLVTAGRLSVRWALFFKFYSSPVDSKKCLFSITDLGYQEDILHKLFVNLRQENDTSWLTDELEHKSSSKNGSVNIGNDVIATTWKDGPYLLIVKIVSSKPESTWSLNGGISPHSFMQLFELVARAASLQKSPALRDLCLWGIVSIDLGKWQYNNLFLCQVAPLTTLFVVSSVNVVMKGSHGYISITEWPLMIVSIYILFLHTRCKG